MRTARPSSLPKGARRFQFMVATVLLLVTAVASGSAAAPASAQTPPPSLQGESFVATDLNFTCDNSASSVSWSFEASGIAMGPYSGTFTESGTATGDTYNPLVGMNLTGFDASFTIYDTNGQPVVTGTKTFGPTSVPGDIFCDFSPALLSTVVGNDLDYDASITTANGSFSDSGKTDVTLGAGLGFRQFSEEFTLSNGLLAVDTTGKATGGGQLDHPPGTNEHVAFGFEVKQAFDPSHLQGRCLVIDPAMVTQVKCLDVTQYAQLGNLATWTGDATVNGTATTYKITVQDNADPGAGADTFSITTTSGYNASGTLTQGNVQVHSS